MAGTSEHNDEPSSSINGWQFPERLSPIQLPFSMELVMKKEGGFVVQFPDSFTSA
jgi:hypothetical protein